VSPAVVPPPPRGPVGATATVQRRLALQRPRPLLVRLYAALLSDLGVLGAPARRRTVRLAGRSVPAIVAVGTAALLSLRVFEAAALGPPQAVAMSTLAATLAALVGRRVARAAAGEAASYREQLELGSLFVVAAYVTAQAAGSGRGESPFQPLVYLVMAFLVAFLARGVGAALVGVAVVLEALLWAARGARGWDLPEAIVHAGFVALFAVLYHAVLAAQVAAGRRGERLALERRMEELARSAREFRILSATAEGADDPAAGERRWTEGAVIEIEAAVGGALDVAEVALRTHTCALFWLSADDRALALRDCRSPSEAIARTLPAGEGALGGAVRRRAPIRLHGDVKPVSYYLDGTRPRALLAVPLVERRGGHVRGVLVADRLEPVPFTEQDERLLETLAVEVLRAVDAERLMRDVRETREQNERFYRAIARLNRKVKLAEVLDELIGVATEMGPVDFAAIALRDEADAARVRVVRATGEAGKPSAELEGISFALDEGLVGSAIRMQATLPAADLDPARTPVFGERSLRGLASLKILPLGAGDQAIGALVIGARRPAAYPRELVEQLEVVAMQAAQSIDRARLFDQTERLATTDGLTGLVNHRTFQERLDAHLAQAQRYGKKISLLLCDIDHFKSVNDTYGHPVGDQVLRGVSRTLSKEARNTDVVARYGGEEFAIVMPETDTAGAMVIAERIRERIGKLVFETEQGPLRVTMSLGVATFPEDGAKKAELVERADGCLYHAKRHGRNQSVAAASLRAPRRAAG
jgi:two-component system, cell cycle response regulator